MPCEWCQRLKRCLACGSPLNAGDAESSIHSTVRLDSVVRIKRLEQFLEAVADEMGCLPGYGNPGPDGENAHIMRKIRAMKSNVQGHVRPCSEAKGA